MVTRKKPSRSAKTAGVMVLISLLVAFLALTTERRSEHQVQHPLWAPLLELFSSSTALLIPAMELPVDPDAKEKFWTEALAQDIGGVAEVAIESGRIDVETDVYAIEIDFVKKWKEGIGQALHYGEVTGKTPALALIVTGAPDMKLLRHIERLTAKQGIRLLVLLSKKSAGK